MTADKNNCNYNVALSVTSKVLFIQLMMNVVN